MAPTAIFGGLRSNLSSFQNHSGLSKPYSFLHQQPIQRPNPHYCVIAAETILADHPPQDKPHWRQPKEPSPLAKQVMSTQAAEAHQHTTSSQIPPQQSTEDARHDAIEGRDHAPPSAPPSLLSAVKSMTATHDPLATLRERPREKSFDSPYARSAASTAPGSPRL